MDQPIDTMIYDCDVCGTVPERIPSVSANWRPCTRAKCNGRFHWHKKDQPNDAPALAAFISRRVDRFVHVVEETIARKEICTLYEYASYAAFTNPDKIWPEMASQRFRHEVLTVLPHGQFSAPDDLDGWTFVHYPPTERP